MGGIKITGLDKLQKALKENVTMDDVKKIVRQNGVQMMDKIWRNADFTEGYQTGQTKRSVKEAGINIIDDGFTVEAGATTEYAPYLEHGTRFMSAQPFVGPAEKEQKQKFKRDMEKLVR